MASDGEHFARWADINVLFLVEPEVFSQKVPSSHFDLSMTGMCGTIFFSLTIQLSAAAEA
jgi:hypothetical protein